MGGFTITIHYLLETMEQLTEQHNRLLQLSKEKTDLIKDGKMEAFQKMLMQERKQIQKVSQLEARRMKDVAELFKEMNIDKEDKTVSVLLEHMEEGLTKDKMEAAVADLIDRIVQIRAVEHLNKELVEQSMQFVQLSLEMMQPTMQRINYNQKAASKSSTSVSVFDSKA